MPRIRPDGGVNDLGEVPYHGRVGLLEHELGDELCQHNLYEAVDFEVSAASVRVSGEEVVTRRRTHLELSELEAAEMP